jgi:hypothetical protein
MKIPASVLKAAWVAGTVARRRFVSKDSMERKLWKEPEQLWADCEEEYVSSMEACARVIAEHIESERKGK